MNKPMISMVGTKFVAVMVVEEEVKGTSSTPFATVSEPKKSAFYYGDSGIVVSIPPMMMRPSSVSQESINENLKEATDGISAAKVDAIQKSVLSSYAIIDDENTFSHTPSDAEEAEIKAIYDAMVQQLDDMRSGSTGNANSKLKKYEFKKHLLIQGQKGAGKTYMVSKLLIDGKSKFASVDVRGHEGVEAADLLGYYIKDETGGLLWKDGPLTQAFRSAAKGTPTVLFIDEMLRIPKRELNILVGALSPDSSGNFTLDTARAVGVEVEDGVGIAVSEKLVVPKSMLWAIGTTNAGQGYSVDTIDEALADRFRIIIHGTTEEIMKKILIGTAKEYGIDKKAVNKLMSFYKKFNTMRSSGELVKLLNLRHLSEVIEFSENVADLADTMTDLIPTLCTMDQNGMPNETQCAIIETLIEKELVV